MEPPKIGFPRTDFFDKLDPRTLFYCKMWTPAEKFWPTSHMQMKKHRPWTLKFGPVAYLGRLLRFLETIPIQAHKFSSTQCTSCIHTLHSIVPKLCKYFCECCVRPTEACWWKPVTQFSGYATVDTTNILSSYLPHDRWHAQICLDVTGLQ